MRYHRILFPALFLFLLSCGKDTFETRPSLSLKSVSTRDLVPVIPADRTPNLVLTFEFTDQEGDLAGAMIGVRKEVVNCPASNFTDTLSYSISADVPESRNLKGSVEIIFPYFKINPVCNFSPDDDFRGDSAIFYVWVRDKAGNVSDTANSGLIRIGKN